MLLALAALAVGGYIAWDLFGPSDRDPNKQLPSIPEPAERLAVARPMASAALAARGAPAGPRVLVIGDSITAGGYFKRIKIPGVEVRGQGWGGQQAVYVARAAADLLKSFRPTDVVILVGVNNEASEVVSAVKRGGAVDVATLIAHVKRDLTHAWRLIHEAGARVWAGTLTPWYGYAKYFGAGKATAAPMRAVHEAVNAWILSMRGQPGGPDEVFDTASIGDAQGRLLKAYTRDDLHPALPDGQRALAALVEAALRGGGTQANVGVAGGTQANVGVAGGTGSVLTGEMFDRIVVGAARRAERGW